MTPVGGGEVFAWSPVEAKANYLMRHIALLLILTTTPLSAQILQYPVPHLESVYPAGGSRGETITVERRELADVMVRRV